VYLAIIYGVIFNILPVWTIVSLATIPIAASVFLETSRYSNNERYTPAMSKAIALSSLMGIILCGSYGVLIII